MRPGTDVFFYLSFLHEVVKQGGVRRDQLHHTKGFDTAATIADAYPPERTAPVTRIPAETLRRMVTAYLEADGAALYSSTGVNMGRHGSLCFWLQETINAATGNLDRDGGTLVSEGIVDFPRVREKDGDAAQRRTEPRR